MADIDSDLPIHLPRSTQAAKVVADGIELVGIVLNLTTLAGEDVAFLVLIDSEDAIAFANDVLEQAVGMPSFADQAAGTVEADTEHEETPPA